MLLFHKSKKLLFLNYLTFIYRKTNLNFIIFAAVIQSLHKKLAPVLAFIVLFSSFSYAIEKDICDDKDMEMSYAIDSQSCDMHNEGNNVDDHENDDQDCCVDNVDLIIGNKNVQLAIDELNVKQVKFIIAYTYAYLDLFEKQEDISTYINTSPHVFDKDYQVLYQTFLI